MPKDQISVHSAVIGGSTGFRFLKKHKSDTTLLGPVATPFGLSAPVHLCHYQDVEFAYISRHGETGYNLTAPFVNYRANIWALKELGVERIAAWSGPAAIDPAISIGEVIVPEDIIDETKCRKYTFFEDLGLGFIRQNPVFCPHLSDTLKDIIIERFGDHRTDEIYVCTEGPRLETPAEIKKYASYGGTLVGMTLVPEVFLAKELEICYSPVCYITNYAEGVRKRSFRAGVLFEGLLDPEESKKVDEAAEAVADIAISALVRLYGHERTCSCPKLMERYRKRGNIGNDWRTWINKPDQ